MVCNHGVRGSIPLISICLVSLRRGLGIKFDAVRPACEEIFFGLVDGGFGGAYDTLCEVLTVISKKTYGEQFASVREPESARRLAIRCR